MIPERERQMCAGRRIRHRRPDDYLTNGAEDSIYLEPEFQKTSDLNAFLKSEMLGKSEEFSPNLRTQISMAKKVFRKGEHSSAVNKSLAETA